MLLHAIYAKHKKMHNYVQFNWRVYLITVCKHFISRGSSYLAHLDSEVREEMEEMEEMEEPTKEHESCTNCVCQSESHNHQHAPCE